MQSCLDHTVWAIVGLGSVADDCAGLSGEARELCDSGTGVGASIGIGMILFLRAMVDVILGVVWLATNRKKMRECPVCGADVRKASLMHELRL
jgi:hypothetical protein